MPPSFLLSVQKQMPQVSHRNQRRS